MITKQILRLSVVAGLVIFLGIAIGSPKTLSNHKAPDALAATAVATSVGSVVIPSPIVLTSTTTRTPVYATTTATVFVPSPTNTIVPPPLPQLSLQKRVDNVTRPGAITFVNPAAPNDELIYTLLVANLGSTPIYNFIIQDDLRDVLEYADVIAADPDNPVILNFVLSWSPVTIPAYGTVTKTFRVRVRNPLSQPLINDYVMTNVFGNTIQVFLANIPQIISPTFTATATPSSTFITSTHTATPIIPNRDHSRTPTKTRTPSPTRTPSHSVTPTPTDTEVPSRTPSKTPTRTPTRHLNPPTGGTLGKDDGSGLLALLGIGMFIGLASVLFRRKQFN